MKERKSQREFFDMKNLDIIKEEVFLVNEKPWIKGFITDIPDDLPVQCIYAEIDGKIKVISAIASSDPCAFTPEGVKNTGKEFVSYIQKYNPSGFKDLLFLLDVYPVDIEAEIERHKSIEPPIGDAIESLLEESRGIMLWHYQMENLLGLFADSGEQAFGIRDRIQFIRKLIHREQSPTVKKCLLLIKKNILPMLQRMHIDRERTFEDLIFERTKRGNGCTQYPNVKGALELYRILKREKDSRKTSSLRKILDDKTPLSKRKAYIPKLVCYFTDTFTQIHNSKVDKFSSKAMDILIHYPWPGGIRELENIVERVVILSPGSKITIKDLPEKLLRSSQ